MLAHAVKIDFLHDDHLVVLDREEGAVQEMIDVAVIPLGHEGESLGHSLGSLEQPVPAGFFTEGQQHLCDQGLQYIHQIRRSAVPADVFDLLLTRRLIPCLAMPPLSEHRGLTHRPRILEVVVACFNQPDLFQLPGREALH